MLEEGGCSLLELKSNFPVLCQFGGIVLSIALFVYRTSDLNNKVYVKSSSISLLLIHITCYVSFLCLLFITCFHAVHKLCTTEWTCILATTLNWTVHAFSLYYNILPKHDIASHLQLVCSLTEIIFISYTSVHVLWEATHVDWWYWPVLLGVFLWSFLCNIGFLAVLYGGKYRNDGIATYNLLSEQYGEKDSEMVMELSEEDISLSICFFWFTEILKIGNRDSLSIEDLPSLPTTLKGIKAQLMISLSEIIEHVNSS